MKEDFKRLEVVIREQTADAKVFYYPNSGNWGDAIIRHGTIKFFKDLNIEYIELNSPNDYGLVDASENNVLIYGGGGAGVTYGHIL